MRYRYFLLVLLAFSCKKDEVALTPSQQLAHDTEVIDNYIESKNTTGVIKDPSGLRYKIHVLGDGPLPDPSSYLKVSYTAGFLPSEELFDASLTPPTYFFATLEQLIEGWRIAFLYLPQGTTATLYIPSGLAYGPSGRASIPPNSNLIFLVEFVDFYNAEPALDADANAYDHTLTSDQLWLSSNLKASTHANGEAIDPLQWSHYNDDPVASASHGKLYSYAVVADPRKVCPTGYKIPSKTDWQRLAGIMGTDEHNAIVLTAGGSKENGIYTGESVKGVFWASDDLGTGDGLTFVYHAGSNILTTNVVGPNVQASVRCIKGF